MTQLQIKKQVAKLERLEKHVMKVVILTLSPQAQTAAKQFLIGLLKSSLSLFSKFPLLPRKKCQLLRYCVDKPKHGKFNFRIDKISQHEGWSRFGKETQLQPMQLLNR